MSQRKVAFDADTAMKLATHMKLNLQGVQLSSEFLKSRENMIWLTEVLSQAIQNYMMEQN